MDFGDTKKIRVTVCTNYFDRSKHIDHDIAYVDGLSVNTILCDLFPPNFPVVSSVNGKLINDQDYFLSPGEQVIFIPAIGNSDWDPWEASKNFFQSGYEYWTNPRGSFWDSLLDTALAPKGGEYGGGGGIRQIPGVREIANWTDTVAKNNPAIFKVATMVVGYFTWGLGTMAMNYAASRYGILGDGQSPSLPHIPGAPTVSGGGGMGGGGGGGGGFTTSTSYAWNPVTLQQLGAIIPRIYGNFRVKGNIISGHVTVVENQGDDDSKKHAGDQRLNVLILLCQGPIWSIEDIKINNKALTDFGDTVRTSLRTGDIGQPWIPNFNDTYRPYSPPSALMICNENIYFTTTGNDFDALVVTFTFPGGLYFVKPTSTELHYEDIFVDWPQPDGTTKKTRIGQKYLGMTTYGGETVAAEVKIKIYWRKATTEWWDASRTQEYTISECKTASFSKDFKIDNLERGDHYEIAVVRLTGDDNTIGLTDHIHFTGVTEVIKDDFIYPRCALVAIEALATNQLSGSLDFSCLVRGSMIRIYAIHPILGTWQWQTTFNNNPAWVAYDILTQPVFSGRGLYLINGQPWWDLNEWPGEVIRYDGVDPSVIDTDSFVAWANFCDGLVPDGKGGWEKRFEFNGVFDTASSVWDALLEVCRMSRAMVYIRGYKYYAIFDNTASPVQMFTSGNIIADSFEETFLSLDSRATEIEVDLANEENEYKRETVTIICPDANRPKQLITEQLLGCTKTTQAWRVARYRLYVNQYVVRFIKFSADIDAIACNIGDLIYFAHDLPQWGFSGRLIAATATTVTLDRDVAMTNGVTYGIRVRLNDDSILYRTHVGVAGVFTGHIDDNILTITAVTSGSLLVGCVISGAGVEDGTRIEVILSGSGGVGTYQVSKSQTVGSTTINITTWNTITISDFGGLSSSDFEIYTFGVDGMDYKPFRINKIQPNSDLTFTIEAVEYNETIYNCDTDEPALPTPNYSSLDNLPPVTNIVLNEVVTKAPDGTIVNNIDVYWDKPINFAYAYAELWYKSDSAASYSYAGRSYTDRLRISNLSLASGPEMYTVVISTTNSVGQKIPFVNCPTATINILGMADPPSDVSSFYAAQSGERIRLDWTHIEDADLWGYEIRVGNAWDSGLVIGSQITDNYFYYTPEIDGTYEFFIKAIDTTNHYSRTAKSVICTAVNITPSLNVIYDQDEIDLGALGTKFNLTYGTGDVVCSGVSCLELGATLGSYGAPVTPDSLVSGDEDLIVSGDEEYLLTAGTGTSGSGTARIGYYYTNTIDMLKTGSKTVRFIDDIDVTEDATDLTFPDRTDLTYPDDTDLHITGEYFKYPSFQYSDGTGFTDHDFQSYYTPATVNGRYFRFREDFVVPSITARLAVCGFRTIIDVPEVKYKIPGFEVTAATGSLLTFADYGLTFYDVPLVQATVTGASINVVPSITNKLTTDCLVRLLDIAGGGRVGSAIGATVDINLFGY